MVLHPSFSVATLIQGNLWYDVDKKENLMFKYNITNLLKVLMSPDNICLYALIDVAH